MRPEAMLTLAGLLTLGQEVDRLVEVLSYEEAGIIVEGRHFVCERVEILKAGGVKLMGCRERRPETGSRAGRAP